MCLCFQINLRLILVSGKTKEFLFSPNDSAADIAKHVYENWPMGEWLNPPRDLFLRTGQWVSSVTPPHVTCFPELANG